jgi:hypothetical protein
MTVAVLYNDSSVTPRALRRAAEAYRSQQRQRGRKALKELEQRFPDTVKSPKNLEGKLMKRLVLFVTLLRPPHLRSNRLSRNTPCPQLTPRS